MESSTVRLFSYFLVEYRLANREKNTNERGTRPCKGKTEKNVRRFISDVRRIIPDDYESSLNDRSEIWRNWVYHLHAIRVISIYDLRLRFKVTWMHFSKEVVHFLVYEVFLVTI